MRTRAFAIILSLLAPGAGHFLLGERVRGVVAAVLGLLLVVGLPVAIVPMLWALLVLRVLAVVDVLVGIRVVRPASVAGAAITGAMPIVACVIVWSVGVELLRMPSSSMEPTLHIGQHVIVNRFAYRLGDSPARGDVIVFQNPCTPRKLFLKRVIALAGDTVEVRCGLVYLDGEAVPTELVEPGCVYDDYDDIERRWHKETCSRYRETIGGVTFSTLRGDDFPERGAEPDSHDFPDLEGALPGCPRSGSWVGRRTQPVRELSETPCSPQLPYVVPAGTVFVLGDNRQNSSDSRVWGPVPLDHITGNVALVLGTGGP